MISPASFTTPALTTLLLAAPLSLGCYDAEALRHERSEAAAAVRMEEIDLGAFQITLPHILGDATDSIVEFHAFGQVERADRAAVARALETRTAELRSRMLISVRAMTNADFDEPKLTALRTAIAEVINGALEQKLVKRVGFYHFSFSTI